MRVVHSKPKVNDIWICKQSYKNAFGEEISISEPIYLFVVSEIDNLDGEDFVRVQPISKEIINICGDDILVEDTSILDVPFIIETWNEQPLLVDVFEKKVGDINFELPKVEVQENYTKQQLDFRTKEIQRTAYLRQSILSSLAKQENDYKHTRKIATYKALSIAASFIGIGLFAWQPGRMSNSDFCSKYTETYNVTFNFESAGGVLSRGNYYLLPNFTVDESMIVQDGLTAYSNNEFETSREKFSMIDNLAERNSHIYFYFGMSKLNTEDIDGAIIIFESLLQTLQDEPFYNDLLYNLSLAYVKNDNIAKSRRTIHKLIKADRRNEDKYRSILRDLRWF